MPDRSPHWSARLPFYYGWVIVGVAFVTMALGVTARTSFSLLMPPLIEEFGWDRGLAAGAFSFGFLVSALLSPMVGRVLDVRGPRVVILSGVLVLTVGLALAPSIERPWQLYLTLGVLVGGGGAAGPWLAGAIHDATGSYRLAFVLAIAGCITSALAIWMAAPRKVRRVPGRS
jgi:cyanate permease